MTDAEKFVADMRAKLAAIRQESEARHTKYTQEVNKQLATIRAIDARRETI